MLTLYVICILCSIMSPWVVGVRTNCNPIIEKNVLSIRYKQRHVKNPFGCLWGPRGKIDVCNSVSDWQVAEIDLEAEALLFSNSKRKTNEDWGVHDWKRHCHCRTTKQYWNSFIYLCSPLFFCVLSLVSAFVSQFVLWMCFHFICGTKCQPQSICACSLSLSILYVHMSMSRTAQFSLPMLLFFTIGIFEIVMLLLSYGLRMPPQHVNSKHTLRQLAVSPLADIW